MGMYEPLLFVHSWMRWAVVIAVLYFFIRSFVRWKRQDPWTTQDNYFVWALNQVFGYQVLFGLTLWMGLSPLTKAGFKDPSFILENGVITFWVLRHPITMILALGLFHIGKAKARRASPNNRFKIFTITTATIFLMIISAIPWPGLFYGRQLFRWFL